MATPETIKRRAEKAAYYNRNRRRYYEREKQFQKDNPSFALWWSAKRRAKSAGLPFDIERDEIVIPEFCPIMGMRLEKGVGVQGDSSPTLDKIDPTKGYVRGNVWVISAIANRMKSNASPEQLLLFRNWISRAYGQ